MLQLYSAACCSHDALLHVVSTLLYWQSACCSHAALLHVVSRLLYCMLFPRCSTARCFDVALLHAVSPLLWCCSASFPSSTATAAQVKAAIAKLSRGRPEPRPKMTTRRCTKSRRPWLAKLSRGRLRATPHCAAPGHPSLAKPLQHSVLALSRALVQLLECWRRNLKTHCQLTEPE